MCIHTECDFRINTLEGILTELQKSPSGIKIIGYDKGKHKAQAKRSINFIKGETKCFLQLY